mmetsp:Transcript_101220/g.179785  ORF Transcript_101220/g.179785 Transcript_101220/m.179785 type:complete len:251 (+) Transcript_101220:29-781(+)
MTRGMDWSEFDQQMSAHTPKISDTKVNLEEFIASAGISLVRAVCTRMEATVLAMKWRSLVHHLLEAYGNKGKKSFLDSLVPKFKSTLVNLDARRAWEDGPVLDAEVDALFNEERVYPTGFVVTKYPNLADLIANVGYTGIFADNSLGDKLAKGCKADGRYIARFRLEGNIWHAVCLVKRGKEARIVDTYMQEKLENEGILTKSTEYEFTWPEYEELGKTAQINLSMGCEVFGKPSDSILFAVGSTNAKNG